jgi:hypothetical protein
LCVYCKEKDKKGPLHPPESGMPKLEGRTK